MNDDLKTIDVQVETTFANCVHLQPLPKIMSGYSNTEATVDASCNDLGVAVPNQRTIIWSNGQKSKINYISTVSIVNGQVVLTYDGVVLSGLYQGSSVFGSVTATTFIGNEPVDALVGCATDEGISGNSGPAFMTITPTL
ncbi:hypothetical protein EA58_02705 [Photobacterium galatheae]|uniref:Uncharacterized protein n=2 Tax=Photobacterium galatheae TaxID=1654360 RepID=A0A066RRZ3_9GAMM|nr:hypothetical protein EA58_02705 [Photobacterium galatheae]